MVRGRWSQEMVAKESWTPTSPEPPERSPRGRQRNSADETASQTQPAVNSARYKLLGLQTPRAANSSGCKLREPRSHQAQRALDSSWLSFKSAASHVPSLRASSALIKTALIKTALIKRGFDQARPRANHQAATTPQTAPATNITKPRGHSVSVTCASMRFDFLHKDRLDRLRASTVRAPRSTDQPSLAHDVIAPPAPSQGSIPMGVRPLTGV